MAKLTCSLSAVAGSCMAGTDPFTRATVEAKPALYRPSLLKQSDEKLLAHTNKLQNETQPLSLLLFFSWDRITALKLIFSNQQQSNLHV